MQQMAFRSKCAQLCHQPESWGRWWMMKHLLHSSTMLHHLQQCLARWKKYNSQMNKSQASNIWEFSFPFVIDSKLTWLFQNSCLIDWKEAIKCHCKSHSFFPLITVNRYWSGQILFFFFSYICALYLVCMKNSMRKMSQVEKGVYHVWYLVFIRLKIEAFISIQNAGHLICTMLQNFCQSPFHSKI